MKTLRFHREAEQELTEARDWYEARSEVAGQAFALEVDHAIRPNSRSAAEISAEGRRGERRFVLGRFPFTILYRVEEDVFIVAFAHESRRPGYWRRRQ